MAVATVTVEATPLVMYVVLVTWLSGRYTLTVPGAPLVAFGNTMVVVVEAADCVPVGR